MQRRTSPPLSTAVSLALCRTNERALSRLNVPTLDLNHLCQGNSQSSSVAMLCGASAVADEDKFPGFRRLVPC
uniref:Secreted protein n=1 Tax=Knipowitschia caucasica TaxID=637954 RepID=A0AAV2MR96_KNICA